MAGARVSAGAWEVLQLLIFLDGTGSMQQVLNPVLEDFLMGKSQEPEIQAGLKLRADYAARKAGVSRLPSPRSDGPTSRQRSSG